MGRTRGSGSGTHHTAPIIPFPQRSLRATGGAPQARPPVVPDSVPLVLPPDLDPAPSDQAQLSIEWTRELYLRQRRRSLTAQECLDAILATLAQRRDLIPPYAPPCDRALLARWAEDGKWEHEYQRQIVEEALGATDLSPDYILRAKIEVYDTAKKALDGAAKPVRAGIAGKDETAAYRTAYLTWQQATQDLSDYEQVVRRRQLEQTSEPKWDAEYEQLFEDLLEQYGDHGAQYRILVRRLASLEVRMRRAEQSGRDLETEEYVKLTAAVSAIVNQLQKYTEATKSEAVRRDVQEAILRTLEIVEEELQAYPQLLQAVLLKVQRRATGVA